MQYFPIKTSFVGFFVVLAIVVCVCVCVWYGYDFITHMFVIRINVPIFTYYKLYENKP